MEYYWDPNKNRANIEKHKIDFEDAKELFKQFHILQLDEKHSYSEDRYIAIGYLDGQPIVVVFTEHRPDGYRLITARAATLKEEHKLMDELTGKRHWTSQRRNEKP